MQFEMLADQKVAKYSYAEFADGAILSVGASDRQRCGGGADFDKKMCDIGFGHPIAVICHGDCP